MAAPLKGGMPLVDVLRFIITTLIAWAQSRSYGEIRIVVQGGQIEFVHESRSHRDRLPQSDGDGADQVLRRLATT